MKTSNEKGTRIYHVLVVDDEDAIIKMITKGLKWKGFRWYTAKDGEEAINLLDNNDIDIVLADINMPNMDGIELTRKVRDEYDADIVVMTGFIDDYKYETVIQEGANDFIHKPVSLKELALRLKRVLRERITLEGRKQAEKELKQGIEKLRTTLRGIIIAMAKTVEMKNPHVSGHQRRVTNLSRAIGTELGFSKDRIEGLCMAAMIHDLGKISIPTEILSKPGGISPEEYAIVKTHPKTAYDILKPIEFPWPVAEIILQHHERIDGTGYPAGLKGDDILLEAKIIRVADIVDSLTSDRPYRQKVSIDKALKVVSQNKGTIYDEQAANACLALFEENRFEI